MIVDLAIVKAQLNITFSTDDALLEHKIAAAQAHIETLLGFKIEERFPPTEAEPPVATVPADLKEAVCLLAAHWYVNREATLIGVTAEELPFGVWAIINEYRAYRF